MVCFDRSGKSRTVSPLLRRYSVMPSTDVICSTPDGRAGVAEAAWACCPADCAPADTAINNAEPNKTQRRITLLALISRLQVQTSTNPNCMCGFRLQPEASLPAPFRQKRLKPHEKAKVPDCFRWRLWQKAWAYSTMESSGNNINRCALGETLESWRSC